MVAFTTYNDRLPDPTFGVNSAGAVDPTGTRGPGFASVNIIDNNPAQVSRTNSGRGVHRANSTQYWEININYHPMLRSEFDVVSSFLGSRNGRLRPFFVVLPQNSKPKDAAFATFVQNQTSTVGGGHAPGVDKLLIQHNTALIGSALPGDFFTISDPNDITHLKVYKVERVDTNATYYAPLGQPAVNQQRLTINPPLTKFVSSGASINWINPRFRVMVKGDVQEYNLNTDNLYQYQLNLEEIQI